MKQILDLWVLCPPKRGQGDLKSLQKSLARQDIMALAFPPFLPLGRREEGNWLSDFHKLGDWRIGEALEENLQFFFLDSQLEGIEGFLNGFEREDIFPFSQLILSLKTGLDFEDLKVTKQTFYTFGLVLWNLIIEREGQDLKGVQIRTLKRIHKKKFC